MSGRQITLALLLAALLDVTVMPLLAAGPARPVLWMTVVTYAALTRRAAVGMTVGALGGLLVDSLAPGPMGAHMAGGIVVGFLGGHVWRAVYRDRLPAQLACVCLAVLVSDLVARLVSGGAEIGGLVAFVAQRSLPAALATAVIGPLGAALLVRGLHWQIRWEHGPATR